MKSALNISLLLIVAMLSFVPINALLLEHNQCPSFDNDFENGTIEPWFDLSEDGTRWVLDNTDSFENHQAIKMKPPPSINNGEYFLSLEQSFHTFGIGLLSTPQFVAFPGDQLLFSYWIYAEFKEFNNIQVFWSDVNHHGDQLLIEHFPDGSIMENTKWRSSSVRIPISEPTEGALQIYGFCNTENEIGIIAIDDIILLRFGSISTSTEDIPLIQTSSSPSMIASTSHVDHSTITPTDTEQYSQPFTTEISMTSSPMSTEITAGAKSTIADPYACDQSFNYDPCSCVMYSSTELDIRCEGVNMTDVRDGYFSRVFNIFIGFVTLIPLDNDKIPPNMFQSAVERINWLTIDCSLMTNPLLEISPIAFQNNISSKFDHLTIDRCLIVEDLSFLFEMKSLLFLQFIEVSNLHDILPTLPYGFEVDALYLNKSRQLDMIESLPPLSRGLVDFAVFDSDGQVSDVTIDRFVQWLLDYSVDTLDRLYMNNNGLTKIPSGLNRFSKLSVVDMMYNNIQILPKESLYLDFAGIVAIQFCGTHTIEEGAFQGDFSRISLNLSFNNLTRFESAVFQPILEQMITVGTREGGLVIITRNFMDCTDDPCHLAWILRDNRQFLPYLRGGTCSDGRDFLQISSNDDMFQDCQ